MYRLKITVFVDWEKTKKDSSIIFIKIWRDENVVKSTQGNRSGVPSTSYSGTESTLDKNSSCQRFYTRARPIANTEFARCLVGAN